MCLFMRAMTRHLVRMLRTTQQIVCDKCSDFIYSCETHLSETSASTLLYMYEKLFFNVLFPSVIKILLRISTKSSTFT